ncbi:MAG: manganese efflux pump, partial [Lachnospiraceae bacterium]|nr:manganese efflux pump [Lachnospiraceae bacterium]
HLYFGYPLFLSFSRDSLTFSSLSIIALLSGGMLTASLFAGNLLLALIPDGLTKIISFLVLFLLALYKFYDAAASRRHQKSGFTTRNLSRKINKDDKTVLSGKEAALLAFALSVDNISAGLCTGTVSLPPAVIFILTTLIHFLALRLGVFTGRLLASKSSRSFAWLSALILMALAFVRIF